MKILSTIVFFTLVCLNGFSQSVGIGTTTPNSKSALEIVQGTQPQGILIPRMRASDRLLMVLTSTDRGMLVYDTDSLDVIQWNGSAWTGLGTGSDAWQVTANKLLTDKVVGIDVLNPTQHGFRGLVESGASGSRVGPFRNPQKT